MILTRGTLDHMAVIAGTPETIAGTLDSPPPAEALNGSHSG